MVGDSWLMAATADFARVLAGVVLTIAVGVVAFMVGGSDFDPDLALLLAVVTGGALGGVRGGLAATLVALVVAVAYYSQARFVAVPGNAASVLMLLLATLAGGWLVGSLRDFSDRLWLRSDRRNRAGQRFQQFAAAVTDASEDTLYGTLVREGAKLVDAEMAVLTVVDPRNGRHVVCATRGTSPAAMGVEVLPGVGITGQALRDRRLAVAGGREQAAAGGGLVDRAAAYFPSSLLRSAADPGRGSGGQPVASVPCLHGGRVTATLTVGRSGGRAFGDEDRLALSMAGPAIGLAVANWLLRRQVRESTLRDPLTGLYNRNYLDAALEQLLALRRRVPPSERKPLSLILFDIDAFRDFNEEHGRKAGDSLVRAVSTLLRGRFRQSDLLARISGDGFLVVLDGADADVAARAAGEIRSQVQALALHDERGAPVQVMVSAGCVNFREEAERADTAIRAVEAALDTARWSGAGAIVAI